MPIAAAEAGVQAEARTDETRSFVRRVRAGARRKHSAEEKIRVVLEGLRRETAVNELCRREGTSVSTSTGSPPSLPPGPSSKPAPRLQ